MFGGIFSDICFFSKVSEVGDDGVEACGHAAESFVKEGVDMDDDT